MNAWMNAPETVVEIALIAGWLLAILLLLGARRDANNYAREIVEKLAAVEADLGEVTPT